MNAVGVKGRPKFNGSILQFDDVMPLDLAYIASPKNGHELTIHHAIRVSHRIVRLLIARGRI